MSRERSRAGARDVVPRPRRVEAVVASGTAVLEPDPDRPHAATLCVDGTPQSHVDLADPTYLCFEYVQHIGAILDVVLPTQESLRLLHLGGGAFTLPRYVAATRPRSQHRVAEIDGPLVALVREELPIDARHRIRVSTAEGRELLARTRAASLDALVVDVFAGARVPASVVTTEFFALAAGALRPTGVLILNIVDGKPLAFARRLTATARTAFTSTAVAAEAAVWRGRRFSNLVLIAAQTQLPAPALASRLAGGPFPARLEHGAELSSFVGGAEPIRDADGAATPQPPPDLFARRSRTRD